MLLVEKETHATFCEADDFASIYSTRPRFWRMCEKAGWKLTISDGGGREYSGPRSELKIRVKKPVKYDAARRSASLAALRAGKARTT